MTHELPGMDAMMSLIGQPAGDEPRIQLDTESMELVSRDPDEDLVKASAAEAQAFEMEAALILQKIENLAVDTEEGHTIANESFILATALAKKIEEQRVKRTAPLLEKKRTIDEAFGLVRKRVLAWTDGLEKKILAYRRKVREEAEEKERQRLAEIRRLEEERRKQQEEEDRKAEEAKQQALQDAAEAGDRLMQDLGIQIDVPPVMPVQEATPPAPAPPPIVAPPPVEMPANTTATTSGKTTGRLDWKWEITDRAKIPAEYWMVDEAKITKVVKAGLREIPGVHIYSQEGLSASTKRGRRA